MELGKQVPGSIGPDVLTLNTTRPEGPLETTCLAAWEGMPAEIQCQLTCGNDVSV
jgi:hypothetical protein